MHCGRCADVTRDPASHECSNQMERLKTESNSLTTSITEMDVAIVRLGHECTRTRHANAHAKSRLDDGTSCFMLLVTRCACCARWSGSGDIIPRVVLSMCLLRALDVSAGGTGDGL
jgi:hypothetical protein